MAVKLYENYNHMLLCINDSARAEFFLASFHTPGLLCCLLAPGTLPGFILEQKFFLTEILC